MSNQFRLIVSSSSSSQITYNTSTTPETGSSRVRRSQPQNQRSRRPPQRGMGIEKLEKLRMEAYHKKMLEEKNLLSASSASSASLVPFSNNSIIHSPFQNCQSSHNFLRSPSPLRNLIPNFSSRSNSPSEYLQNFGRNNCSFHPQHFQSSLNNSRTAPPVLQPSLNNIPNSLNVQTPSDDPSRSVIDSARVFAGMVASNRAHMDPYGYMGVGNVLQTSSSQSSVMNDLCIKKQRTSQERAVLNVVDNRKNAYDSLRSDTRSYGGQYANNNLGGSVMTHAGLIAAQQDGVQTVNAYKRKEIVFGYEIIPGEGAKGIGLLEGAHLTWNDWTALSSAADPPLVSPTTPNSSITSFHSEETDSGAETIDLTLKLSI